MFIFKQNSYPIAAKIITAFCVKRTVNLKQVANAMTGKAKADSNYRKLQRFFSLADFCYNEVARYIVSLFVTTQRK